MGHADDTEIVQAVRRAQEAAQHAQLVASFEVGVAIKALIARGHSQREVARMLSMSKSNVNRCANQADAYAVAPDHDRGVDEAMRLAMWGPDGLRDRLGA